MDIKLYEQVLIAPENLGEIVGFLRQTFANRQVAIRATRFDDIVSQYEGLCLLPIGNKNYGTRVEDRYNRRPVLTNSSKVTLVFSGPNGRGVSLEFETAQDPVICVLSSDCFTIQCNRQLTKSDYREVIFSLGPVRS